MFCASSTPVSRRNVKFVTRKIPDHIDYLNVKIFDYIRKRPENRALFKWLSTQKTALVEGYRMLQVLNLRILDLQQYIWD